MLYSDAEEQLRAFVEATGIPVTVIGGAKVAYGIDAERAIREGFEWARSL